MKTIRPIGNRILIKPCEARQQSDGGIYLPTKSQEQQDRGIVVDYGSDVKTKSIIGSCGSTVIYSRYAGIEVDGYRILKEDDVIAIIEAEGTE